jgi:DNA mismatch repair protein MutS
MTLYTKTEPAADCQSLLYAQPRVRDEKAPLEAPPGFSDLLLDQVVASITKGREEYELLTFFYDHLTSEEDIEVRHEVWRDLENPDAILSVRRFVNEMRDVRQRLNWSSKTHFAQHRRGLHLDAAELYCDAVENLTKRMTTISLHSRGLIGIRNALVQYSESSSFHDLAASARELKSQLSEIRYSVVVRGPRVRVLKYEGEADYGCEIEEAFERFQQGAVNDYRLKISDWPDMNHVESQIADRVALLFRETFSALQLFSEQWSVFVSETVRSFEREIQFYLAYLDYIDPLKSLGLNFCLPTIQKTSKEIHAKGTFDIALAKKLSGERRAAVTNDFSLDGVERIIIVSGPNQGGKTTFARTFGQIHFLGSLGCPVSGEQARLYLFDELFTHFGKEEDQTYQSGKLEDDLLRIRDVLVRATPQSIIIMNEIFSSTTTQDALALGTRVIKKVIELDSLCVIVTFIDELTLLGPSIVSMTSTVNPKNPVERTFKVVRHIADGLAYAIAIADKYGLTYERLRKRIGS